MRRRGGNWQERAKSFQVGQSVALVGDRLSSEGRVLAVWPAIGMCDVQYPTGSVRLPVEDLQIIRAEEDEYITPTHSDIPGGPGTVPVPTASRMASLRRITALYWNAKDRQYRCTRGEFDSEIFTCPKCGEVMKPTIYKREKGKSVRLLGCPGCMFLIRRQDILDDHCDCEE